MPETVILNPDAVWHDDIQDNMNPDYGFARSRPSTRAVSKPAGGRPYSRETANTGHSFQLSWLNRSFKCVQRLKYFYEQFEDDFFTVVDWDGGGRHYVGRFTGDLPIVETGNDRYQVQGATFEEIPGAPMLEYPGDWDHDSVMLRPLNGFRDLQLALSGTWAQQLVTDANAGTQATLLTSLGTAGDFATHEYRGYGFRLSLGTGPAAGQVQVLLDGVSAGILDLYAPIDGGVQPVLTLGEVPLGLHRVKVSVLGTKNVQSAGAGVTWGYLEVMR